MRRYLRNLWLALTGNNPFRIELDELRTRNENNKELAEMLQRNYDAAMNIYKGTAEQVKVLGDQIAKTEASIETFRKREASLQRLVENLRESVTDKESVIEQQRRDFHERMERMKADYQKRIDQYVREIDQLKSQE